MRRKAVGYGNRKEVIKMDVSNSGGNVWMVNGRPIAGWCRKCGEFTLDVVSLLCVSCSLNEVIANIHRELAGHITPEKTNKNEGEIPPPKKLTRR